jgi:hypothetical protein
MASSFDYDFVKDATPAGYEFPSHRLKRTCDPNRQPLILVACGSCKDNNNNNNNSAHSLQMILAMAR